MTEQSSAPLFAVAAESYDRLMGRYLPTLGVAFADAAGITAGQRALDVGCGPGGLTTELVRRVGAESVAAIDPSATFVAACRERHPGVDVRQGVAEDLPWHDGTFDAALGSLITGFLADPGRAAAEMRRVTAPGGSVGLCFWELERMPLITTYWQAVFSVDSTARGEAGAVRSPPWSARGPAHLRRLVRGVRVIAHHDRRLRRRRRLVVLLHRRRRTSGSPVRPDGRRPACAGASAGSRAAG